MAATRGLSPCICGLTTLETRRLRGDQGMNGSHERPVPMYMWSNNPRDKEVKRRSGNEWQPREACPHVYVV